MSTATLNECRLIGNVGADPEVKTTESGKRVATVRIATTNHFRGREVTEWHRVVFWEALAERVEKYVSKGSSIFVGGRLQSNTWNDKDGVKRYGVDVVAEQLQLLGGKREASEDRGASLSSHPPGRKEADAKEEGGGPF